jgi:protein gp37
MAENSKIEWCDHSWNSWEGCQKVGPGCDNCYAEARNARFAGGQAVNWGPGAPRRRTSASNWRKPLVWNANHENFFSLHGRRQRVFCASLSDVFDNAVDPRWRQDLFDLVERTPNLDWLFLTKRVKNVPSMLPQADWAARHNVWLGISVVNQDEANRDIPRLLAIPATKRFLSIEPLLGEIDLRLLPHAACLGECCGMQRLDVLRGVAKCDLSEVEVAGAAAIDWVIVGGESGPQARPVHPNWVRALRDQCQANGVPFLFKQWGEWRPAPEIIEASGTLFHRFSDGTWMQRAGKKVAGRMLDGRVWDEQPASSPAL